MDLPLFDVFAGMPTVGVVVGAVIVLFVLGYMGASPWMRALDSSIIAGLGRDVTEIEVTRNDAEDEAPVPQGDGL